MRIPLLNYNRFFLAELVDNGIKVNNLGNNPFLIWDVFTTTVELLENFGGVAKKDIAMNYNLE